MRLSGFARLPITISHTHQDVFGDYPQIWEDAYEVYSKIQLCKRCIVWMILVDIPYTGICLVCKPHYGSSPPP